MMDRADFLAALPLAIRVQPQAADGHQAVCPFLVHFPTGFVPDKSVTWKVRKIEALFAYTFALRIFWTYLLALSKNRCTCKHALGNILQKSLCICIEQC